MQAYLISEVVAGLSKPLRAWLLRSALLDRFCAPLCEAVCDVLRGLPTRASYVFRSPTGDKVSKQYLSRRFRFYARRAALEGICFHSTRHTAASWLAQQGCSVEAIRRYMGH